MPQIYIQPTNAQWEGFPVAQDEPGQSDTSSAWDAFPLDKGGDQKEAPPKQDNSGVIADLAKSAGAGLVKGATSLIGLPGDTREAIGAGMDYLAGKFGYEPNAPAKPRFDIQPTTAEILTAAHPYTGDLHQPETTAGKYAETAAEFVPSALLAPTKSVGGVIGNAIKYGIGPGVASEAAGQLTEGSSFEPYARVLGAIATGGLTAAMTRPGAPEQALLKQIPDYVTQQHIIRAHDLITAAKNRGIDLTWPEALSKVTGRPVLTDMQRILESTGESRATMQGALAARPQQVGSAAQGEFGTLAPANPQPSTIGPKVSEAAEQTLTDVRKKINTTAEPFYKGAENVLLTPAEMAKVHALPGYDEAVKAVRSDPQLNRYVEHLPENSVGFLNEVKKYFDQQATNANRPFAQNPNMQRAAGYGRDARSASQIGQTASLDYATALALETHLRERYLDPLMNGPLGRLAQSPDTKKAIGILFSANPLAGSEREISTTVSAIAKRSPQAARDLIRAHAEMVFNEAVQNLQTGANEFGGAKFAVRLVGNPQQRANLKAAVEAANGPQAWAGFEKFLDVLEATGKRQAIGSKTAFNIEELKSLGSGSALSEAAKLGASPGKWMSVVHDKWSRYHVGHNLDDLARIITDPASAQIFKSLVGMPTRSSQAGALAARLILQAEAAARKERKD